MEIFLVVYLLVAQQGGTREHFVAYLSEAQSRAECTLEIPRHIESAKTLMRKLEDDIDGQVQYDSFRGVCMTRPEVENLDFDLSLNP